MLDAKRMRLATFQREVARTFLRHPDPWPGLKEALVASGPDYICADLFKMVFAATRTPGHGSHKNLPGSKRYWEGWREGLAFGRRHEAKRRRNHDPQADGRTWGRPDFEKGFMDGAEIHDWLREQEKALAPHGWLTWEHLARLCATTQTPDEPNGETAEPSRGVAPGGE